MGSESESCVDELLVRIKRAEELGKTLEPTQTPATELLEEARTLVRDTQLYIDNHKAVIPSFILKQVSDALRKLEKHINTSNKSKLTFKFKTKPDEQVHLDSRTQKSTNVESTHSNETTSFAPAKSFLGFQGKTRETLSLGPDEVDAKDISLIELVDCMVTISGLASTVYIRNLKNTSVTICLACRAITVRNCTGCHLNLVCQQLRIDASSNCKFALYTSSRSMLEASNELSFEELKLDEDMQKFVAIANFKENNWRRIDDFDWLSPDVPSANYKLRLVDQ